MKKDNSQEIISVRIQCKQEVIYDKTVEMTRENWKRLKKTHEGHMECPTMSPLTIYVDLNDVDDTGEFSDFEIRVVDEEGDPLNPSDYYGRD